MESVSETENKEHVKRYIMCSFLSFADYIVHTPNRVLNKVLGEQRYEQLKKKWRG